MTNNLKQRLQKHHQNIIDVNKTFAAKYNLEFLVYYEKFTWVQQAILREKELKRWRKEIRIDTIF
jgi:putative endonuclease